jgi:hypothetical protein
MALAGLTTSGSNSAAQTFEIDLGSSEAIDVHFFLDPLTLVHIPPGAFGVHPPGTLARISLDIPNCDGPNCLGGRALLVSFDDGGCCGSGRLENPVWVQVSYNEEDARQFGVDEDDLVLARYDRVTDGWIPLSDQTIDPDLNAIRAPEAENIQNLFVGVFATAPQPVEPATWGGIKSLFGGPQP